MGKGSYGHSAFGQTVPWEYLYLPISKNGKAEIALAVYREAMSVNSIPYAFLGFFKVLSILRGKGGELKKWINTNLEKIRYTPEKERLVHLEKTEADIGLYLYHQGRCAIAHAFSAPIVNPDKYSDKERLELDLCLMKAIAALFIENEFQIMSCSSYYKYIENRFEDLPELLKKIKTDDGKIVYKPFLKEMNYANWPYHEL